jgi:hypothetical protein
VLGGHLARRWGGLLRHLRLAGLGLQARLFVHLDPLLARNRRDQFANRFERQIVRRLEMNATFHNRLDDPPVSISRHLQLKAAFKAAGKKLDMGTPDEALIVAARYVPVHECAHRRDRLGTIGRE